MTGRMLVPAAAALALALPSAATAKTYTVDPGAAVGCNAAHTCKTITNAVSAFDLVSGDEIVINDGSYEEPSTVTVTTPGILIRAKNLLKVQVTQVSSDRSGIPVFSLVNSDHLDGIVVNSPADGGPAVLVKGRNTTVSRSILSKTGVSVRDTPVYSVDDDGVPYAPSDDGVNNVNHTSVLAAPSASAPQVSATIQGSTGSTLFLDSVIAFAGKDQGPAVVLPGNDTTAAGVAVPNRIVASVLGATRATQAALAVTSNYNDTTPKLTEIDSSVLNGGAIGVGLKVRTGTNNIAGQDNSGDVKVVGVHVTIAGVNEPFVVDAMSSGPSGSPKGSVDVTFDKSIIHGTGQGTVSSRAAGGLPLPGLDTAANTAHVIVQNSDTTQLANGGEGAANVKVTATTNTPEAQLFRDAPHLDFHLLATAPVIDKGGAIGQGNSTLDFDGDNRLIGAATDLGADEFQNHAPTAVGNVAPVNAKQGQAILYDATKSTDPDGPIASYVWNFGDGTTQTTTVPYTTHSFALLGDYFGSVTAIDTQGASSVAAQLPHIHIGDGSPPKVAVSSPKAGKTFARYTTKTSKNKKTGKTKKTKVFNTIKFSGTATDEAGVANAEMQIKRLNLAGKKPNPKVCITTDGKHRMKQTSCKSPVYFRVSFKDGKFSYSLKAAQKLPAGTYELSVRATDKNANTSVPVVVTFKLK